METIEALCTRYQVDLAHAQHVATLAAGLFDAVLPVHQLDARMRELLEAGALVHNVGMSVDEENHHTAGRDIVMAAPLAGYDQVERAMLACMAAFHRKAVQPEREALFSALGEAHRRPTLILSAILRIADGLDYSQTQSTQLADVELEVEADSEQEETDAAPGDIQPRPALGAIRAVRVRAHGPCSHEDARRATKKADLWNALFPPLTASGRMTRPGLTPDMTLAEAGRRVLRYQLDSLAPDEWILPRGRALSAQRVHRIRVTTRRLRSTLRTFGRYYKNKGLRPVDKGLRVLSTQLRLVREYDAAVNLLKAYVITCDANTRFGAEHLLGVWRARRKAARSALADTLSSAAHARWLAAAVRLAEQDKYDRDAPPGQPSRVRHAACLMQDRQLARVRAHDTLPDLPSADDLHRLRVAVKRLRYLTDALQEALPTERGEPVLALCVAAQDAYGAINDARAAALCALRYLGDADSVNGPVDGDSPAASDIMSGVVAFAEQQQHLVEERTQDWRRYLEPLLMI